ncbi:hypothetical protein F0562_003423 [Nyssa sinensis]|uniref:Uncharacterized protein n=1 Tax=Nyssa sinensis TaxID=561372 RepID=A0A5J5BWF9_9ASTE|nr:hypothetical protein F0562_003423 [Nyssa sinensis]
MSNQEDENPEFSVSNSIDAERDSGKSNNEIDNNEIEDDFESRDLEANHFTPNSLDTLKGLHIMATLDETIYESHDLEAQLQLQLMSSAEAANKIEDLKNKLEDIEMELETAYSLTNNLRKKLVESSNAILLRDSKITSLNNEVTNLKRQISKLRSNLSIAETTISEVEMRHRSEIEAARVAIVEEQKDKILKLRRRLASNGYNFCLKKMSKAYPEVNTELLDQIKVSTDESGEYKDDEEPVDSFVS